MKVKPTVLACDFCGKTQHEVTKLISGPEPTFPCICETCIQLCADIIATENATEACDE